MNLPLRPRREDAFWPFEQAFDRIFDDFFNKDNLNSIKESSFPRMNVLQTAESFLVTYAVPGLTNDQISVEFDESNKVLTIRGGRLEESNSQGTYHRRELRHSSFERSIKVPDFIHGDPVANLKDGLLKLSWDVELPNNKSSVKKITVNSS